MRPIASAFATLFVISTLVGCGEKPSRIDPERGHSYNQSPQNSMHGRTLEQGESERMGR